jgi:hypothetical protein
MSQEPEVDYSCAPRTSRSRREVQHGMCHPPSINLMATLRPPLKLRSLEATVSNMNIVTSARVVHFRQTAILPP